MRHDELRAHATKVSHEFIERYRHQNHSGNGQALVPEEAYANLGKDIERRILLIGRRSRKTRRA